MNESQNFFVEPWKLRWATTTLHQTGIRRTDESNGIAISKNGQNLIFGGVFVLFF